MLKFKTIYIKLIIFLAIPVVLFVLPFSIQGACDPGANPASVAGGLISATTRSGLSTSIGKCVVNTAAALSISNIPSFNKMKATYYDQYSPSGSTSIVKMPPMGNINNLGTLSTTNSQIYYINGDVTLGATNLASGIKSAVFFINGRLIIQGDLKFNSASSGLVFIVGGHATNGSLGNIYIAPGVSQVDAVLMADGGIYTASNAGVACSSTAGGNPGVSTSSPLIVNGSLMTLNTGTIYLCRNLVDDTIAAEQVNYQAKYLVILRDLLPYNRPIWKEVAN